MLALADIWPATPTPYAKIVVHGLTSNSRDVKAR